MAIEKLKEVNLISDADHIQNVLLKFKDLDYFHPELAQRIVDRVSGLKTLNQTNPYSETLAKIHEICESCQLQVDKDAKQLMRIDLKQVNEELDEMGNEFQLYVNAKKDIQKVIDEDKLALEQLLNVQDLDINFDHLFQCTYLKLRIGKMPKKNLDCLNKYGKTIDSRIGWNR